MISISYIYIYIFIIHTLGRILNYRATFSIMQAQHDDGTIIQIQLLTDSAYQIIIPIISLPRKLLCTVSSKFLSLQVVAIVIFMIVSMTQNQRHIERGIWPLRGGDEGTLISYRQEIRGWDALNDRGGIYYTMRCIRSSGSVMFNRRAIRCNEALGFPEVLPRVENLDFKI